MSYKKLKNNRYKESNFISLLEKEGIGRPSTYATFLPTLLKREYVIIETKGKNQNIIATNKGINFIQTLKENDDEWITQSEFTKQMENVLDEISSGNISYLDFIKPLHEKMGFKELSNSQTKPPSDKQLEWAKSISKDLNIALPSGIEADWKICSNFIEKNKGKIITPPSEKQIELAKKLSKDKGLSLPKGYDTNLKICKEFIDKAIKKR